MADGQVRRARSSGLPWSTPRCRRALQSRQVVAEVGGRIQLTPHELSRRQQRRQPAGRPRCGFYTGDAATIGWMTKRDGWAITEAGLEALDTYPTPDELFAELNRRYREIDQRRKQAQQNLSDVQQFIATTMRLVEPGTWTAHDDLAELAGTTGNGGRALPRQRQGQAAQCLPGARTPTAASQMRGCSTRCTAVPISAVGWPAKASCSMPEGGPRKIAADRRRAEGAARRTRRRGRAG